MNVLIVGDNSTYPNWGGRGASLALYQMLQVKFNVSGVITGADFHLKCYVNTIFPSRYNWVFRHLCANRDRRKTFDYYLKFEEFFGAKDFVANDPAETANNIIRYRSKCKEIGEVYDKAQHADLIVIHGEGDVVFTTPPRREALFLLGMAELGLRLNKKVVFANGLISDCPTSGRNIETLAFARKTLSRCNGVIVRDYESFEYVRREIPEAVRSLIPDSLFTWFPQIDKFGAEVPTNGDFIISFPENRNNLGKLNFSKPYICIGGSALAAQNQDKSAEYFSRLLARVRDLGYAVYLTENCGGDSFLQTVADREGVGIVPVYTSVFMSAAILANARLFISGRYHPTILASLGGTPCIFLGSSAHKMHSLQKLLEYDHIREFPVYPSEQDISEIIELAQSYLAQGESLRRQIKDVARKRCEEAMRLPELVLQMASI